MVARGQSYGKTKTLIDIITGKINYIIVCSHTIESKLSKHWGVLQGGGGLLGQGRITQDGVIMGGGLHGKTAGYNTHILYHMVQPYLQCNFPH